jgi:hypothetical protein
MPMGEACLWDGPCERHAYDMAYERFTPMGTRLWDGFCEEHA